jgi:hypothetical protein
MSYAAYFENLSHGMAVRTHAQQSLGHGDSDEITMAFEGGAVIPSASFRTGFVLSRALSQ